MVEISNEELIKSLKEVECDLSDHEKSSMILEACKQRAQNLDELKSEVEKIVYRPTSYDEKDVEQFIEEGVNYMLHSYINLLDNKRTKINSVAQLEEMTKPFIAHNSLKIEEFCEPLRICLTGGTKAVSVYELIVILGVEETMKRIEDAIYEDFGRDFEW